MDEKKRVSRRSTLKGIGALGTSTLLGTQLGCGNEELKGVGDELVFGEVRKQIFRKVHETPLIDTHEHLMEEKDRGKDHKNQADDWTVVMTGYLSSDLQSAGMSREVGEKFYFNTEMDPIDKWKLVEPYWPAIRNTGYGQVTSLIVKELYGIDELSAQTIVQVQENYEKTRQKGFYKRILRDLAGIESCQVNSLEGVPFRESEMPEFLMQDISIVGMFAGPNFDQFQKPTGLKADSLDDWHKVIDWWFDKYGEYAVAVKSQHAYSRDIDYERVSADLAAHLFTKKRKTDDLSDTEKKQLEDHLFWYAVDQATENNLPVKLHTGYYAGGDYMPLGRLVHNAGSATDLCRRARDTKFVFMHICYPYYEEILSVAKHYSNAYIDMCWAAIINPIAAKDFLKKYLLTAPANKILTFGGDYRYVEPVLGHAIIAKRVIALALSELVEEGWITIDRAMELTDMIMHENARQIFNLPQKERILRGVQWS